MTASQLNIRWEEHSRLHESCDDCDLAAFVKMLGEQFPGIYGGLLHNESDDEIHGVVNAHREYCMANYRREMETFSS